VCGALVCTFPGTALAQWGDDWLNAAMPSRPLIETRWAALALPMGELDVLAAARRLDLTREQLAAFEASLKPYLEQACGLRCKANQELASIGLLSWDRPDALPAAQDVRRCATTRQTYERDMAALDSALWDRIAPLVSDAQQSRLARERLRRDRRRMLTDGSLIDWSSRTQLMLEVGDFVEALNLSDDQRNAALALVGEFETQATARLRSLLELANTFDRDWLEAIKPGDHPQQGWQVVSPSRMAAARDVVDLEYEWVDRIAGVLDPEKALAFRMVHAGAHTSTRSWADSSYLTALSEAVAGVEGIDAAARATIATKVGEILKRRQDTLPELISLTRKLGVGEAVRVGGHYRGMTMEEYQRQMPLRERRDALSNELWEGYNNVQTLLKTLLTEEQMKAVHEAESAARVRQSELQPAYSRMDAFGAGNVVTMISMGVTMDIVLSDQAPRTSVATLAALGMGADEQAAIDGALTDFAERWSEQRGAFLECAKPLLRWWGQPQELMDVEVLVTEARKAVDLMMAMERLGPEASESLRIIVENDRMADRIVAVQQWADVAAPPRNCPAPMEIVRSSHYRTLASHLDRIDPAIELLKLGQPSETLVPAWQALIDEAQVADERVWALRQAVAEAYLESSRVMRWQQQVMEQQRQGGGQQLDWNLYRTMQESSSKSCAKAQRLRREHIEALERFNESMVSLLPPELQPQYAEGISREAYPDAWSGFDRAQRLVDRALSAADLTDAQRQQVQDAWVERQAALRDQAHAMERRIAAFAMADDMTRDAAHRCASLYADIEQAMFERDESALAMLPLLRPILTPAQMESVEATASQR